MLTSQQIQDIRQLLPSSPPGEPLAALGPKLLKELGIDWKAHRETPKQKFTSWLTSLIPELCTDDEVQRAWICGENTAQPLPDDQDLKKPDGSPNWKAVADRLLRNLNEEGYITLTNVNSLMIRWELGSWRETLEPGEETIKMYTWAERRFGTWFVVDHFDLVWFLRPREGSASQPAGTPQAGYPLELDPDSPDSLSEVKAMHAFAWMGAWNQIGRRMFSLTGLGGPKDEYWRAILAHKLNQALTIMGDYYRTANGPDGTPRAAVRLDLSTPDGKPLYLVFTRNERLDENPNLPRWRLLDCCWPGQDGLGIWLCTVFGLQNEAQAQELTLRRELSDLLAQLEDSAQKAQAILPAWGEKLADGARLREEELAPLREYAELWAKIDQNLAALGRGDDPELSTGTLIRQQLFGSGQLNRELEEGLQQLQAAILQTRQNLEDLHLTYDEPSLQGDLDLLARWQDTFALGGDRLPNLEPLLELTDCYGNLARFSGMNLLDESEDALLEKIAGRLGVPPVRLNRYFVGEGSLSAFAAPLSELSARLHALNITPAGETAGEETPDLLQPDHLSEIVGRVFSTPAPDRAEIYRAFKAPNALELALINCDFAAAARLAEDGGAMAGMGYEPAQAEEISRRLAESDNLSRASLPLACADRLYAVERYANRQAEKFWLAALPDDEAFLQLAALFRRQDRQADFLFLMEHRPQGLRLSPAEYHYFLKCYADGGEYQKSLELLEAQPELLYHHFGQESNLELAAYAARQCGRQDLLGLYERLALRPAAATEADALEEALIALGEDTAPLEELLSRDGWETMGYSQQDLDRVRDVLHRGEYPTGSFDFEVGLRLWEFLGSRHGLAEQFMWKGVLPSQLNHQMSEGLFPLLSSQERWEEICLLFEAHRSTLSQQADCRRYYLSALCRLDPARAAKFARDHLVDALEEGTLLTGEILAREDPELGKLLQRLDSAAQSHEYVRCVILAAPGLRDFVLQPDRLSEFGMDEAEAERIMGCYKTDSYPRRQDPASLGLRIYTFLRDRYGLAEALARFALPQNNAALLLAHILGDRADYDTLAQLFGQQPALADSMKELYLRTLENTGNYRDFLTLSRQEPALADKAPSFRNLALLMEEDGLSQEDCLALLEFSPQHIRRSPGQFLALSARLARRGFLTAFARFVPAVLGAALPEYSAEDLRLLVTGGDLLAPEALEQLCREWTAQPEGAEAALCLWHFAGVGELGDFAQHCYEDWLSRADAMQEEERRALWSRMLRLYPEKKDAIQGHYLLGALSGILTGDEADQEKSARIQALLQGCTLAGADLDRVLDLFQTSDLLNRDDLVGALQAAVPAEELPHLALRLTLIQAERGLSAGTALCGLYVPLLADGKLPEEALAPARQLCEQAMRAQKRPLTAACLWAIYRLTGQQALAGAAYVYLMSCASADIPPALAEELTLASQAEGEDLTLLGQFLRLLRALPLDKVPQEVETYRHSARLFVVPRPVDRQIVNLYTSSEDACGQEEAECILRLYCYSPSDPEPALALRCLPIGQDAALRLRLAYLDALAREDDLSWNRFDELLAPLNDPALSLRTAALRLRKAHDLSTVVGSQQYALALAERIGSFGPELQEDLRDFVDAFCSTLRLPADRHKTLCNLALLGTMAHCSEVILNDPEVWNAYLSAEGLSSAGVFACRLLLCGDIAPARRLLSALSGAAAALEYHPLYRQLAALDPEELARWAAREESRRLLGLVLPDGQRPSYEKAILPELVFPTLESDDPELHQTNACILTSLMELFPEDSCLGLALFHCCKRDVDFEDRLLYLYRAEAAMCRNRQGRFMARPDARQRDDLVLLGCLLNKLGLGERAWGGKPDQARYQTLLQTVQAGEAQEILRSEGHWNAFLAQEENNQAVRLVLARLTGDWKALLADWFSQERSLTDLAGWLESPDGSVPGFTRGLLRLWVGLEPERRAGFTGWLQENLNQAGEIPGLLGSISDTLHLIRDFYKGGERLPEAALLELPLEERSLDRWLYHKLEPQENERDSGRILLLAVCQQDLSTILYCADEAFREHRDQAAALCYQALCTANRARQTGGFGIDLPFMVAVASHRGNATQNQLRGNLMRQQIYARRFMCAVMAGLEDDLRYAAENTRIGARCQALNSMIQLIDAGRCRELPHYLAAFAAPVRAFLLHAYRLMNGCQPDDTPASKLAWALRPTEQEERHLCLRFLSRLLHRSLPEHDQVMEQIARNPGKYGILFCPNFQLSAKALPWQQLEELLRAQAAQAAPAAPAPTQPDEFREPEYARRLLPLVEEEELYPLPQLLDAHEQNARKLASPLLTEEERPTLLQQQRLCSLRRYRREIAGGQGQGAALACLALGVDEWNCQWQQVQTGAPRAQLDECLFEAALVSRFCPADAPETEAFRRLAPSALYNTLFAAPDLETLVGLYQSHTAAFALLREQIAPQGAQGGEGFCALMDSLAEISRAFQDTAASDEMRLNALDEILQKFNTGTFEDRTWRTVRSRLQSLLTAAAARLRDRPRLTPQLFNTQICLRDSLFGEVQNNGSQTAVNITLHALAGDVSLGGEYTLNRLRPGCRAPFRIPFDLPEGTENLCVTLSLSYSFGGQVFTAPLKSCTLKVAPPEPVNLPISPYPTQSVMDYTLDEEGNITSRMLFGRQHEKAQLQELVSGGFANYRDAFVRGVRRAGKTSLLHYLGFYITHCCRQDGVLPVYVSCQDCADNRYIHNVFVCQVLDDLATSGLVDISTDAWAELRRRWDLPPQAPDRTLGSLKTFFVELSQALGGKKLVLMLDELDTLIQRFERDENVYNGLLSSLDGLLDDANLHRYVHFILCGSNNLIRYQMDGGILHQAFQRINSLEVGSLPYQDIKAMLCAPCRELRYTLRYTEAALEYIYRFTGGAVWYTRLLGAALVDKLAAEQRSVVYPSDVCDCTAKVITITNCKQFYEACGNPEKAVLQSLQRYTGHLDASAAPDEIRMGLPEGSDSLTLNSSLELLQQLGLICQLKDSSGTRYRFATEMHRQFFRSQYKGSDCEPSDDDQFRRPARAARSSDARLEELAGLL